MYKKLLAVSISLILAGCGGGGTETPNAVSQASVTPVTLSSVQTQPTECTNPHTSDYPLEFAGSKVIPYPAKTLDTQITRSIGLKDYHPAYWHMPGTPTDYGCQTVWEYTQLMYTQSLDKIKALGTDEIYVYNYAQWLDITKDVWEVDQLGYQIPEHAMKFILDEANKRNIKVNFVWQFHGIDVKGNNIPPGTRISPELLKKMLESYRKEIVKWARFGQQHGLSGISADWNAYHITNLGELKEQWNSTFSSIIDDIRREFSGKITFGMGHRPWYDKEIMSKIDAIHITVIPRLTEAENLNLSVELLKAKYLEEISHAYHQVDEYKHAGKPIPVVFGVFVQSRDKFYTEGWIEDGFCMDANPTYQVAITAKATSCVQQGFVTDFSLQAMGVEATMQALNEQKYFKVSSVFLDTGYWLTDTLKPGREGFPNLSQSIRGKPAEKVVKHWFSRG